MTDSDEIKIGIEKVDNKTRELIIEFQSHYNEYWERTGTSLNKSITQVTK